MQNILGRLIVFEGLDGAGKSTQIYLLKKFLEAQKVKVFLSQWNSSSTVKEATRKGKKQRILTPTTFSLIHSTDFTNRYEREIFPLLEAGFVVLCDRFIYTAFARDVARGCDRDWVKNLYSFVRKPDITFYCRVPLDIAVNRILGGRSKLKYFEAGMDIGLSDNIEESFRLFQSRVFDEYEKLCADAGTGFKVIDASLSIKQQQDAVREIVKQNIDILSFRWRNRFERRIP
ncbi:dTMP kinase [bacterium Unc6]|nr:dTMP kinase [bacterium Unc6]